MVNPPKAWCLWMKCQEWSDPSYVGAKKVQDSPCLFDLWYIIKCEKIEKNHWANKLVGLNISFFSGIAILVDLQLQFEAYLSPSPLWKKCPMSLLPVQSCPNLPHHTGHWISPRGFYIINHHISSLMSFIIHFPQVSCTSPWRSSSTNGSSSTSTPSNTTSWVKCGDFEALNHWRPGDMGIGWG